MRLQGLPKFQLSVIPSAELALGVVTYFWIASCTKWWVEPIPLSLDFFITGNEYCMASGSIGFACHCYVLYATSFYNCGLPLGPLLEDLEKIEQKEAGQEPLNWDFDADLIA